MRCALIGLDLLVALLVCSSAVIGLAAQYLSERSTLASSILSASNIIISNASIQAAIYSSYATGAPLDANYLSDAWSAGGTRLFSRGGVLGVISVNG